MLQDENTSTRKKIIMASISVFAQKGYRDATVREICKLAGSANINSVNYYFGSKEKLYKEILEMIFASYDKQKPEESSDKTPEQKLKDFINAYCAMLYKGDEFATDLTKIFVSEMLKPSPFLEELVDKYNRPQSEKNMRMIRDILGDHAPDSMVRDCLVSIGGQLLYYSFAWPVFSRLFPEYSTKNTYKQWAEHVYAFSMGGIEACRQQLADKQKG